MRKKEYEVASTKPTPSMSMDRRTLLKTGVATAAALGLSRTPALAAPIENLGFCPIYALKNDNIRLFGLDFGSELANISIKGKADNNLGAFLRALSFEGNEVVATLSGIPSATTEAAVEVAFGNGAFLTPSNLPAGLAINSPIWVWMGQGDTTISSFQKLGFPFYGNAICAETWHSLVSGRLYGDLTVPYDANCCAICPSGAHITLRFCANSAENIQAYAYDATLITTTPMYVNHLVDAICTIMVSAFNSQFGVELVCQQDSFQFNHASFTISGPSGALFHSGFTEVVLQFDGQVCDSLEPDSLSKDSVPPDSVPPDSVPPDSASCESQTPDCDSIAIDFEPFIFN